MDTNLQSLRVLVTRPEPKGFALCQSIEALQGKAHYFPTISFSPPVNQTQFLQSIQSLGEQDWLIFVSPRSVSMSIPAIRSRFPQFSSQVHFAAVGEGTAKALKKAGYIAIYPSEGQGTEALLSLPVFQDIQNKKITIIRGAGGRELLAQALIARGAMLTEVVAYQRELPVVSPKHYRELFETKQIDVVVCTSFDGVHNLKKLMGDDSWPFVKKVPLIVVSQRIKKLAEGLGFQSIQVASAASNQAILTTLTEFSHDRRK